MQEGQSAYTCHDIVDKEMLDYALQFAAKAHKGQLRKGTDTPYIVHPLEVVDIVSEMTEDTEILVAAALHDVLEDTDVKPEEIRENFGENVLAMVQAETENKRSDKPPEETWFIRKKEMIVKLAEEPLSVKMIVLADKLSNLRATKKDYHEVGHKVWDRFHVTDYRLHRWYYTSIGEHLKELAHTKEYKEFQQLCKEVFYE